MANKWTASRPTEEPPSVPGARWIALTQGKWALVDNADFEVVCQYTWCYVRGRTTSSGYTQTNLHLPNGKYKRISMHGILTGHIGQIDHINGNGLDNRRANLRIVNDKQNRMNSQRYVNNASGFKGVTTYWSKSSPWRANIRVDGKQKHLGVFKTAEEAAHAYDAAAIDNFGEYARLNFPKESK